MTKLCRRVVVWRLWVLMGLLLCACSSPEVSRTIPDASPTSTTPQADVQAATVVPTPTVVPGRPFPEPWASAPLGPNREAPGTAALAAVVLDEASNTALYDKNAHTPLPPASLTKIVTLILALEYGHGDTQVNIDVDSRLMRGSTVMGLEPGDVFSFRDLLFGMMLPSGNDAALAIGRQVSGTDATFVTKMNQLTQRLGLHESNFINPHGLGGTNHVSSAYDLAEFSRYGMSLPGFRDVVMTSQFTAHGSRDISFANINSFAFSYAGADGIKTGYTRSAGQTLVAAATRNGHRLYAVILNSPQREYDARVLLDWAFANFNWGSH